MARIIPKQRSNESDQSYYIRLHRHGNRYRNIKLTDDLIEKKWHEKADLKGGF